VHIEQLVVSGLPLTLAQGVQLQAALERELAGLLARERLGPGPGYSERVLAAPEVRVAASAAPARLGRDVARSVFSLLRSP
jgi:hypothetical protein